MFESPPLRRIRSYVCRQGRLTSGQKIALDTLSDAYCLDLKQEHDFTLVFGRVAPMIIEVGFGNGESLVEMAKNHPEFNFLGIEVHRPGIGHLMVLLEREGISNVRIFCHDALEILQNKIPDSSLAGVHLFFPDPWPKKKHHKRRIVQAEFCQLLVRKLLPGGYFHAATDWQHYAETMLKVLMAETNLVNTSPAGDYRPRPDSRPLTKFERRGLRLGHRVWDLLFKRV